MNHILKSQQFDTKFIKQLFKRADELARSKNKKKTLRGKIMASLFYEPSTRTRFSFESAMLKLGGGVISTENAKDFSSASKGETLEDSIRVINHYADVIVLRHPEIGASIRASLVSNIPVINAGDGAGQHPTQALLDLYTIKKQIGRLENIKVAFVGDLKNGRTVHSLAYLLGKFKNITIYFISPKSIGVPKDIKGYLNRHSVEFFEKEDWNGILETVDVLYQTRIQKERFKNLSEYKKYLGKYILNIEEVKKMKKQSIIMHPLPRLNEIERSVDKFPQAVYFKQVQYGLLIRMALLEYAILD